MYFNFSNSESETMVVVPLSVKGTCNRVLTATGKPGILKVSWKSNGMGKIDREPRFLVNNQDKSTVLIFIVPPKSIPL